MSRLLALAWQYGPGLLVALIEAAAGAGTIAERKERVRVATVEQLAKQAYRRHTT